MPALVALSVLALAGCSGSSSSEQQQDDPVVRAPGSATPSGKALGGAASAKPGQKAAAGGTTPTGGTAAGTSGGGSSGGTTGTAPAPAAGKPGSSSAGSTAPGDYTYDSSGTVTAGTPRAVKGTATLTVDPAAGPKQHSVLEGDQGRTEQDVVHGSTGTTLARLLLTNPAFTKEFKPAKPVLVVPSPPTVGKSWSWTMTSTDGKTKASLTARITKTESVTVGGVKVNTAVVESTLKLTGDVTYTGKMRTNYDASRRLQVKERTQGNGMVGGFAFTTDITSVLRSTKPS